MDDKINSPILCDLVENQKDNNLLTLIGLFTPSLEKNLGVSF